MKRRFLSVLSLSLFLFALTGISYGWQGKMAGMGAPYGLVSDESDLLIHPALLAEGEGTRFYGDYRFVYTNVNDWDNDLDLLTTAGALASFYHYDTSGQERTHEALLGSAFPLGRGRMGLFLSYDMIRGDHDGHEDSLGAGNIEEHSLTNDLDDLALRLLYGLPLDGFSLGGELQFAYRNEENKSLQRVYNETLLNYHVSFTGPDINLLPYQVPFDSSYWEALLKGSITGAVGPADAVCTLRGGLIFAGDNHMETARSLGGSVDMEGNVDGWNMGGDLWVRYPLGEGISLPFLMRADYQEKMRDGSGPGKGGWSSINYIDHNKKRKDLQLVAGGGMDKELGKATRIAAGIYYNYLQGKIETNLHSPMSGEYFDNSDCPLHTEHRVLVRLAGEHELSSAATVRAGLDVFHGWAEEDFKFNFSQQFTDDLSLDGHHRGIEISAGGTVIFDSFTLEPFLNASYRELKLDGNGKRSSSAGTTMFLWKMDKARKEWYAGGGFSVLFDL